LGTLPLSSEVTQPGKLNTIRSSNGPNQGFEPRIFEDQLKLPLKFDLTRYRNWCFS